MQVTAPTPPGAGAVMWCASAVEAPPRNSARIVAPRATASEPSSPEVGLAEPEADDTGSVEELVVEPVEVPLADPVAAPVMRAPGSWDMVPTTLPTYVTKPAARRRTVSTIDLDSTGVWSSGHNDEDSALARSAEESARSTREADEARRASGA